MYIWGIRARQHLRSLVPVMNEYGWLWWPNDIRGLKLPDICLTGEEKPRKNITQETLSRPGIEPGSAAWQAHMLPPDPQRWTILGWPSQKDLQPSLSSHVSVACISVHICPLSSVSPLTWSSHLVLGLSFYFFGICSVEMHKCPYYFDVFFLCLSYIFSSSHHYF